SHMVVWFFAKAVVLFRNPNDAYENPHFFRRKALTVLGVGAFLQAYTELVVLPLWAEIAMQPVFFALVGVSVVAAKDEKQLPAKRLVDGLLGLAGLALVLRVTYRLAIGWSGLDKADLGRQMALPIWLTVGLLPFVYAAAVYAVYEVTFLRMTWNADLTRRQR